MLFSCVTDNLRLRPCQMQYDKKVRASISAKISQRSPVLGNFVYKYFRAISWAFVILMFASIFSIGIGAYNTVVYGNCNGEDSTDFCIFNPGMSGDQGHSMHEGVTEGDLKPTTSDDDPSVGSEDAKVTVIEFGCYTCPYTKKAEYVRKNIVEEYGDKVRFVFRNFPLPNHQLSSELAEASECADDQGYFWEYHDQLFENQKVDSVEKIKSLAFDIGLDMGEFNECLETGKFKQEVEKDHQDGMASGLYGTPTFFINGRPVVGPRDWGTFKSMIDEELAK